MKRLALARDDFSLTGTKFGQEFFFLPNAQEVAKKFTAGGVITTSNFILDQTGEFVGEGDADNTAHIIVRINNTL